MEATHEPVHSLGFHYHRHRMHSPATHRRRGVILGPNESVPVDEATTLGIEKPKT
jgi:hypothetical protein